MLDLLRRGRWLGFTLFALFMVGLCVLLAHWQWTRYETRQSENQTLDAAVSAPAVPLDQVLPAEAAGAQHLDPALEWRMVTATGTFDTAGEVAVRRRPLDGKNGFWIVTPLVTDSGTVLVNRGWTPVTEGGDATTTPQVAPPPDGTVTVTGRLRAAQEDTHSDPPPPGQAWAVDPDTLLAGAHAPVLAAYIEIRSSDPDASQGLTLLSDPGHRGWNNLVYTVQWLLFGLVAMVGWWRLLHAEALPVEPEEDEADQLDELRPGS